ncbi:hypothetical protein RA280_27885 [Cupriavidus sp. CV2]|nr:hypothetical protein [Cupriavidus sp. CV2]MDW3685495.1 hypothetical protein [Cupriavidus sp. CV2]
MLNFEQILWNRFVMLKNRKIVMPTPEEDEAINRGIAADPDTYELSAEEIKAVNYPGLKAGACKGN